MIELPQNLKDKQITIYASEDSLELAVERIFQMLSKESQTNIVKALMLYHNTMIKVQEVSNE